MTAEQPSRRAADGRLVDLEKRMTEVAGDVRAIRDMLISEPEASPLGRGLLKKSIENRAIIEDFRDDFDVFVKERFVPLERSWHETRGAWRALVGLGLVLSTIATFFGLASWFGLGPTP